MEPADLLRYETLKLLLRQNQGRNISSEQRKELALLSQQLRQEDAERFGEGLPWLNKLLFEHDPIGLAEMGVPKDEYEIEARMILKQVADHGCPNFADILNIVYGVFLEMFHDTCAGQRGNYHEIAEALVMNDAMWRGK